MGRPAKNPPRKVCDTCGSKHASNNFTTCLACRRSTFNYKSEKRRKYNLNRCINKSKTILEYKQDIKVLTWKNKAGILNEIDCFIVCSIYMDTLNQPDSYAGHTPNKQVVYMLNELNTILAEKLKTYNK
jgi:hypothetical protein